jgi:hypothetical protein
MCHVMQAQPAPEKGIFGLQTAAEGLCFQSCLCRIRVTSRSDPKCGVRPKLADNSHGKVDTKTLGIGVAIAGAGSVALVYIAVLLKGKAHELRTSLRSYMPSGCCLPGCLPHSRAGGVLTDKGSSRLVPAVATCDPLPQPGEKPSQAGALSVQAV